MMLAEIGLMIVSQVRLMLTVDRKQRPTCEELLKKKWFLKNNVCNIEPNNRVIIKDVIH